MTFRRVVRQRHSPQEQAFVEDKWQEQAQSFNYPNPLLTDLRLSFQSLFKSVRTEIVYVPRPIQEGQEKRNAKVKKRMHKMDPWYSLLVQEHAFALPSLQPWVVCGRTIGTMIKITFSNAKEMNTSCLRVNHCWHQDRQCQRSNGSDDGKEPGRDVHYSDHFC